MESNSNFKSLKEQLEDSDFNSHETLFKVLELLSIDERGGGPEGIYFTSELVDEEFLSRNLRQLIAIRLKQIQLDAWKQGMTDAANLVEAEYSVWDDSIRSVIHLVEKERDNKTTI